jgi:hypothetical protein
MYYCLKQEEKLKFNFSGVFYSVLTIKSIDVQVNICHTSIPDGALNSC